MTTPPHTEAAMAAFRAAGWPGKTDIDGDAIVAQLVADGVPTEQATHAFHAALARLVAELLRSPHSIDVDACTSHLLVLRQRDQVRHLSIDYVLQTMTAVVGPIFPPPHDSNLH
ncbi:hypothetical protein [Hydrogenophaga electricum]|uniref:Uncharacterized protein n=1 Tax=Hydrogenophaga electricum TaxID=1230953 RepID=A0ABQ6C160_9BURK|nr:hypothetical protein [Hydrogenophaga electricum]GLS13625.1 hypothetical protein GCM10007935_10550 [Hydrogenophaga electricum]